MSQRAIVEAPAADAGGQMPVEPVLKDAERRMDALSEAVLEGADDEEDEAMDQPVRSGCGGL